MSNGTGVLIYFNGYLDGMHEQTTWDERLTGRRIDEALAKCRASSASTVLHAAAPRRS